MRYKMMIGCLIFSLFFLGGCITLGRESTPPLSQSNEASANEDGFLGLTIGIDGETTEKSDSKSVTPITIVMAEAHKDQLLDEESKEDFESISDAFLSVQLDYQEGTINFVFIKGVYHNDEQKLSTVGVLVNKLDRPINEIHGVLRLRFRSIDAEIAKATLDFDADFMGILQPDEGLLFNINIPVRGLNGDRKFSIQDIEGSFDEIRFTYSD